MGKKTHDFSRENELTPLHSKEKKDITKKRNKEKLPEEYFTKRELCGNKCGCCETNCIICTLVINIDSLGTIKVCTKNHLSNKEDAKKLKTKINLVLLPIKQSYDLKISPPDRVGCRGFMCRKRCYKILWINTKEGKFYFCNGGHLLEWISRPMNKRKFFGEKETEPEKKIKIDESKDKKEESTLSLIGFETDESEKEEKKSILSLIGEDTDESEGEEKDSEEEDEEYEEEEEEDEDE
jgi:hypothetical protein